MTSADLAVLVETEIGDNWSESNAHGVSLRSSLVRPDLIKVIDRRVEDGRIHDEVIDLWLILEERPKTRDGYKIVYDERARSFGLATQGFKEDSYPVLVGFYGDFWTTFEAM